MGFNCVKARATSRWQFTFNTNFPEILGTLFVAPQKHPNKERYFKKEVLQTMLYIDVIISIDITLKLIKCTRHNSEMKSTHRSYL